MRGNTPPWARPANDQGAVAPELELDRMLLVLRRGAREESALRNLLAQQQDAASPQYHGWLTPAQFGSRFGLGAADLKTIEDWLRGAGFHALAVSRGRNVIEFSGTAAQVEAAFHTSIHRYRVSAAQYWSNANDPAIPAALAPAVAGVVSLNNFRRRPEHVSRGLFSQRHGRAVAVATAPQFTYSGTCGLLGSGAVQNCFAVGPNDLATIYNVTPLWNAGVDGSGETIAIPARADLTSPPDITAFRAAFGLPANPPTIILNGPDPVTQPFGTPTAGEDRIETTLEAEWAGAVAKGASVDVVISASTASTDGIDLSNLYIVDNNIAPILSVTYGACELGMGTAGNLFYDQLWEQAAAEGISVFVAAGDSGAAGCDQGTGAAVAGLAVNGLASPPWAIAVGGTDFDDLQDATKYWAPTNNPGQASALGYIPETVWNDSCTNAELSLITGTSSAVSNCNNPQLQPSLAPVGGGGGKSACTTSDGATPASCSGGYAKPAWQPANGDGARDLPDVSLFAGNGFNGNAYIVCDSDLNAPCNAGPDGLQYFFLFGGTSLATPVWAGIQALVDQKTGSRQGDPAYVLYSLASQQTGACDSSSSPGANCVFLDITRGTNAMACASGSVDCTTATAYGILPGYNALAGYDLASGLGSVNVANLVNAWAGVKFAATTTSLQLTPTSQLTHGQAVTATVSVTPQSGSALPTGAVSLETSSGASAVALPLNASGGASGATNSLPGGTYAVTAYYPGDGRFAPSRSQPVSITIAPEPSTTAAAVAASDGYNNLGPMVSRPYGSAAYFTAQIRGQSGYGAPGGAVTFTLDGQPFSGGPYILSNQGYASTLGRLYEPSVGQHTLLASYPGDASFAASASAPLVFTITPGPTATTIIVAPPGILHLSPQLAEINADVVASSWVTGQTPAGTLQFYYNQQPLGAPQTVAGGDGSNTGFVTGATLFNPQLPFGPGTLSAAYSGDGNFAPSVSAPVSVEVQAQASLTVTAPASAQEGQPVAVAFTVTSSFAGGPAIGGTIQATANEAGGASQNATLTVANGAAQWNLTNLPVGSTTVVATYSGDANYLPSIGISTAQVTVAGPTFAMTAGNSSMTVSAPGGSATTTISTQAIDGFTAAIAFSCTGLPAKSACSFTPLTVAAGGATQLSITTTAASAMPAPGTGSWPSAGYAAALFFCLGGLMLVVRRRWARLGAIAALAGALAGCGGGGAASPPAHVSIPGTPVGTSTVSVVGTGGGVTKTLSVTLTVQ